MNLLISAIVVLVFCLSICNFTAIGVDDDEGGIETYNGNDSSPISNMMSLVDSPHIIAKAVTSIRYTYGRYVLTGPTKVYIVWYGGWLPRQQSIVTTFISRISSTQWFNIEKTYYYQKTASSARVYIKGPVLLGTQVNDYNRNKLGGTRLTGDIIPRILKYRIGIKSLPDDTGGIYFFLVAPGITESNGHQSFCKDYCGYHSFFTIGNKKYFYAVAVNQRNCPGCANRGGKGPGANGDPGVDGMMSTVAHEIVETLSDPITSTNTRAWVDRYGNENADKCNTVFGPTKLTNNKARYNMVLGQYRYLIQQNWNAKTQRCASSA